MRTVKIIIGICCLLASLFPGLLVMGQLGFGRFDFTFAVCFLALLGLGVVLILKRNSTWSQKTTRFVVCTASLLLGFVVAVVIPDFVAATRARASNACASNLHQIDAAKNQWKLDHNKKDGEIVTDADLKPYIRSDLKCPQGGTYIIGHLGEDPKCSIGNSDWPNTHALTSNNRSWWMNFKSAYKVLFGFKPQQGGFGPK